MHDEFKQCFYNNDTIITDDDFNNFADFELKNLTLAMKKIFSKINSNIIINGVVCSLNNYISGVILEITKGNVLSSYSDYIMELTDNIVINVPDYASNNGVNTSQMIYVYLDTIPEQTTPKNKIYKDSVSGNISIMNLNTEITRKCIAILSNDDNLEKLNIGMFNIASPTFIPNNLIYRMQRDNSEVDQEIENMLGKIGIIEEDLTDASLLTKGTLSPDRIADFSLGVNKIDGMIPLGSLPVSSTANRVLGVTTANTTPTYVPVSDAMISSISTGKLSGTINAGQLAGGIDGSKLANLSMVTYGSGVNVNLNNLSSENTCLYFLNGCNLTTNPFEKSGTITGVKGIVFAFHYCKIFIFTDYTSTTLTFPSGVSLGNMYGPYIQLFSDLWRKFSVQKFANATTATGIYSTTQSPTSWFWQD